MATNEQAMQLKQKGIKFMERVANRKSTFQSLLPKGMQADWFLSEVKVAVARVPKLLECDELSVFDALTTCAQLGLSPSGRLGSAYLIPYGAKCTLVVGYKGYLDLAYRSGEVVGMRAQVVYEADTFEWEEGLEPRLVHQRSEESNPGPLRAVYAVAEMKGGYRTFVVMTRREVEAIKARSPGAKQKGTPWATDEAEMWKKTAIRRAIKLLPLSPQKAQGLTRAQEAEDADFEEMGPVVDSETGEVEEKPAKGTKMDRLANQLVSSTATERLEQQVEEPREGAPVDRRKRLTPEAINAGVDRWNSEHPSVPLQKVPTSEHLDADSYHVEPPEGA